MPRYRLIDAAAGADLGPFLSKRKDWLPGDKIGRSKGEDMAITAVIEPEDDEGFRAYLVVALAEADSPSAGTSPLSPPTAHRRQR